MLDGFVNKGTLTHIQILHNCKLVTCDFTSYAGLKIIRMISADVSKYWYMYDRMTDKSNIDLKMIIDNKLGIILQTSSLIVGIQLS